MRKRSRTFEITDNRRDKFDRECARSGWAGKCSSRNEGEGERERERDRQTERKKEGKIHRQIDTLNERTSGEMSKRAGK